MMAEEHRTPYAKDALRVENGTEPEDIREFVERRAQNPVRIDDVTVWNFNNHELNMEALEDQVNDLMHDEFIIPFQASGVWGYMFSLLPTRIREAEVLTYRQDVGTYTPFPNYYRHSDKREDLDLLKRIYAGFEDGTEI